MKITYTEFDPNRKSTRYVGYKIRLRDCEENAENFNVKHVTHAVTTVR